MTIEINIIDTDKVKNENEVLKRRIELLEQKYNNEIMCNLHLRRQLDYHRSDKLPIKESFFEKLKKFKI